MPSAFVRAIETIKDTLTASHIAAFPLWWCDGRDEVESIRKLIGPEQKDFSHVLVRKEGPLTEGALIKVLHREDLRGLTGPAWQHARPLEASALINARTPLRETLGLLAGRDYLLVRSTESGYADGLSGIINDADVQKLPVRLFLFAHVAEIETLLRDFVASVDWLALPSAPKAIASIRKQRGTSPPDLLEWLNLAHLGALAADSGWDWPGDVAKDLDDALRNRTELATWLKIKRLSS